MDCIAIPSFIVLEKSFTPLERSLLLVIAANTINFGEGIKYISLEEIASALSHGVIEVKSALDSLEKKHVIKRAYKTKKSTTGGYTLTPEKDQRIISHTKSMLVAVSSDSANFINIDNEAYEALKIFALERCDELNMPYETFVDFELEYRSLNPRSYDWKAEFEGWLKKAAAKRLPVKKIDIEDNKPNAVEFEMALFFISKMKALDPLFEEPFDVMSWGKEIKYITDVYGYPYHTIKKSIDWLFSPQGNWMRPSVQSTKDLKEKFKKIVPYLISFADNISAPKVNIFDICERVDN